MILHDISSIIPDMSWLVLGSIAWSRSKLVIRLWLDEGWRHLTELKMVGILKHLETSGFRKIFWFFDKVHQGRAPWRLQVWQVACPDRQSKGIRCTQCTSMYLGATLVLWFLQKKWMTLNHNHQLIRPFHSLTAELGPSRCKQEDCEKRAFIRRRPNAFVIYINRRQDCSQSGA